jgi:nucleoside-triphosphatase
MTFSKSNKVILLTGKPRVGKSTLIKKIVEKIGPNICGGFYTEEIRDSDNRIGFNCVTIDGISEVIAHVESRSSIRVGRYGFELEAFENIAIKSIGDSLSTKKIIVIDEIGFMQMYSDSFQKLVYKIVSNNQHIVLGTVPLDNHPQIDPIKNLDGVKIIPINEDSRDSVSEDLINSCRNL